MNRTIEGTIRSIDLSHVPTTVNRGLWHFTWASMELADLDKEHRDDFAGFPKFEWQNSEIDAQCADLKPGDRVLVELNDISIPLSITHKQVTYPE